MSIFNRFIIERFEGGEGGEGEGGEGEGGEVDDAAGESVEATTEANEAQSAESKNEGSQEETSEKQKVAAEKGQKTGAAMAGDATGPAEKNAAEKVDAGVERATSLADAHEIGTQEGAADPHIEKIATETGKRAAKYAEGLKNEVKKRNPEKMKEFEEKQAEHEAAQKEFADDVKNKRDTKASEAKMKETGEALENKIDEMGDMKESMLAKGGRFAKDLFKFFLKNWKLLVLLGAAGGLYTFLKAMADDMTGCYKYTGTDGEKLACNDFYSSKNPANSAKCGCGGAPMDKPTMTPTECTPYDGFPYCNTSCPGGPTCSSDYSSKTAILYAYHLYTPLSIVSGIVKYGTDLANDAGNFMKMFIQVLKYGGVAIAVLFALFIVMKLISFAGALKSATS